MSTVGMLWWESILKLYKYVDSQRTNSLTNKIPDRMYHHTQNFDQTVHYLTAYGFILPFNCNHPNSRLKSQYVIVWSNIELLASMNKFLSMRVCLFGIFFKQFDIWPSSSNNLMLTKDNQILIFNPEEGVIQR